MVRVFIKRWILFFLIIVFDYAISLRVSIGLVNVFFWFLLSIVVISFIWITLEYCTTRLVLEKKVAGRLDEGDILDTEVLIRNDGILPCFNLVLKDYLGCAASDLREKFILLDCLWPKASLILKYKCSCPQRGKYRLGPFEAYFFDPLGLFFLKKSYYAYSEVYVYPQVFHILKFPLLAKGGAPWFGIESSRVSGDEHEFYGIREYKQGDPIKKIHWFSTARQNKLIVKQFQRQSFYKATIMFNLHEDINFGEGSEALAEYIIKISASVATYLINQGISLQLIVHAGEMVHLPFNKGPEHLEDILRFLAVAKVESKVKLSAMFQELYGHIPEESSLIMVMSDTDCDCLPMAFSLSKRNISLVPLVLNSSSFFSDSLLGGPAKDANNNMWQLFDCKPIFFSKGDNLADVFLAH